MNKEEIEKMELEYTNVIRERIENAIKCEIGLDAVLTIGYRMIKLQDIIDKAIEYCEDITSREIDISDTDYELGEDFTARDILKILRGENNEDNK